MPRQNLPGVSLATMISWLGEQGGVGRIVQGIQENKLSGRWAILGRISLQPIVSVVTSFVLLLFVLLWWYSSKQRPRGAVSGAFLVGYGFFRFVTEFTRQPDDFLGLLSWGLSMGQWLSLPMIVVGVAMMAWAYRRSRVTQ